MAAAEISIFGDIRRTYGVLGSEVCSILAKRSLIARVDDATRNSFEIPTAGLLHEQQNELIEILRTATILEETRAINEGIESTWMLCISAVSGPRDTPIATYFAFNRFPLSALKQQAASRQLSKEIEEDARRAGFLHLGKSITKLEG